MQKKGQKQQKAIQIFQQLFLTLLSQGANRLTLSKIPNELELCDQVKNGHTAKKVTL